MKKALLFMLIGFIFAQGCEYLSCYCVDKMQAKCYPLWTQGKSDEYQACMENEKTLNFLENVLGFNFIYRTRSLIAGY